MPVIVEEMPFIPEWGSKGKKSVDGMRSESARMVEKLRALPNGHCITIFRETGADKEFDRKRTHWTNAANRAGLEVATRLATTDTGDKVLRIWRIDP